MNVNKKNLKGWIIVVCTLITGCALMYGLIYAFPQQFSTIVTRTEKDVTVTDSGIADAVDKVYDSVVIVSTYDASNKLYSTGTGFVYKLENGKAYIMTNAHVIENGKTVTVTLTNGEIIETDIIGLNSYEDIAVLTIDEDKALAVAQMGNSDDLRVGDTTFAVGAPLDNAFSWTVTRGIISGKDRLVTLEVGTDNNDYVIKVLQTDAAINSGNSGGPLNNSNGEVIGVNTLKLMETGVEGMGFAIPIETALEIADEIISGEESDRPLLGITMIDYYSAYNSSQYETELKVFNDNELYSGIYVMEVSKNSSADISGIKSGDIITELDGVEVPSIDYLKYELYQYKPGDKVTFTIYRDGSKKEIKVTLVGENGN